MFRTILNLFGRSPFTPLQIHLEKVETCVYLLKDLFEAMEQQDTQKMEIITSKISEFEHAADLTKNDIRNHLTKNIYLPIDKAQLLEILSLQDHIADSAEDVSVLTSLRPLAMLDDFREDFYEFLSKNLESFHMVSLIIREMNELLESSFGGLEAQKVKQMVEETAFKEHEVDVIQVKLLKGFYGAEEKMSYATFQLWLKIFEAVGSISNLSEKLAYRVRMTLDIK